VYNWQKNVSNVKLVGQFHDEIVLEWSPGSFPAEATVTQLDWYMTRTMLRGFPLGAEIKSAYRYIK
jgi:hypothetical protein